MIDAGGLLRDGAIEIERLRAERDKWVEYVTCDRAQLVLDLETALARAEKAEAILSKLVLVLGEEAVGETEEMV